MGTQPRSQGHCNGARPGRAAAHAPQFTPPGTHLHLADEGLGAVGGGECWGSTGEAQGLGEQAEQGWPARGCRGVPQSPVDQPFPQGPPAAGEAFLQEDQRGWLVVPGLPAVPLHVSLQAHVNGPTAPTSTVSMRRGRKGDVQMGGAWVPCTPATGGNNLPCSLHNYRPGGAITHCNGKPRHRHWCASKHWGNQWQHRNGTQPSLLLLWPPDSLLSHPLCWDGHPQITLWWDMEVTWRMSSAPLCPPHAALLLTSSCIIFSPGPNPSHRSRSWVSSGTKGKEPKKRRYTCTGDRSGAAERAGSGGTRFPSNAPA